MRKPIWRGLVTAVAAAGLTVSAALAPGSPAIAAPITSRVTTAVTAQALPSYATWIDDVTAVTSVAQQYLGGRLPDSGIKAAIVLDIDNTALASGYSSELVTPATPPVLAVAKQAVAAGAKVFFVSNRTEIIGPWTEYNLSQVGYTYTDMYLRAIFDFSDVQTMKTNARIDIESRGYTIVASIGNNDTDLAGGHAERTFKLPDYDGQLD